ncbi:MAG: sensor histidine kinase [Thermomicrobiales bacterium]
MTAARVRAPALQRERLAQEREDERRRVARELHDGPAQSLAAALFGVDLALATLDRAPASARDELLHARELLRDALNELRSLMFGLRPRLLEEKGLAQALAALAGMAPLWGPKVTVTTNGGEASLADDVELALYRIAQEAITNARKHSGAAEIRVDLQIAGSVATLTVVDDGQGFPPRRIRPAAGHGEGLPGMRERAALLGGTVEVASRPGSGTRVEARLPLADVDFVNRERGEG